MSYTTMQIILKNKDLPKSIYKKLTRYALTFEVEIDVNGSRLNEF
ncbi:MAG: hypothetical protein WAM14_11660 [Candidatus Nitrosopolaris sp.]